MNLLILLAIVGMAISSFESFLGLVTGIAICYFFLDKKGKDSTIRYHLTHWSWFNIRV